MLKWYTTRKFCVNTEGTESIARRVSGAKNLCLKRDFLRPFLFLFCAWQHLFGRAACVGKGVRCEEERLRCTVHGGPWTLCHPAGGGSPDRVLPGPCQRLPQVPDGRGVFGGGLLPYPQNHRDVPTQQPPAGGDFGRRPRQTDDAHQQHPQGPSHHRRGISHRTAH